MGTIIWLVGLMCSIWCVLDILKKPIGIVGKLVMAVVVLATSWLAARINSISSSVLRKIIRW